MEKWLQHIGRQRKSFLLLEVILFVALLGIADYLTGEELFFLEFYLIPVLLVTWFLSENAGILISLFSGIFWFIDDVIGRTSTSHPLVPLWNIGFKIVVFIVFVVLISSLKEALDKERQAEQKVVRRELEIARQVQQRLFPQFLPKLKTLDYTGLCMPLYEVGGDYYDILSLDEGVLGIALADVSGKGISAALLMSNLQAIVRSRAYQLGYELESLVAEINSLLFSSTDRNKYATLFYGIYEEAIQRFTYVNAGHNPPFLFRNNQVQSLMASGTVVGLIPNLSYKKLAIQLYPGDVLVLYTDGISEACDEKGHEFGEQRLMNIIQQNLNLPAEGLAQLLLQCVQNFAGNAPQRDDQTLLILKVRARL